MLGPVRLPCWQCVCTLGLFCLEHFSPYHRSAYKLFVKYILSTDMQTNVINTLGKKVTRSNGVEKLNICGQFYDSKNSFWILLYWKTPTDSKVSLTKCYSLSGSGVAYLNTVHTKFGYKQDKESGTFLPPEDGAIEKSCKDHKRRRENKSNTCKYGIWTFP